MSVSYISTHFVHIPPLDIFSLKLYSKTFFVEVCCMETSIDLFGISGNCYIVSFTECFFYCDL